MPSLLIFSRIPLQLSTPSPFGNYFFRKMSFMTAGVLIVGDEVLKGQVKDTNSHFIAQKCYEMGVSLKQIRVVPDDVTVISNNIKDISKLCDVVISCGGIGSTHDDVTFEAAAKAFDDILHPRKELVDFFYDYFKIPIENKDHPSLKMTCIPSKAKLNYGEELKFPVVSIENVFFFPGIPQLLERSFTRLSSVIFSSSNSCFYSRKIYSTENEVSIVNNLNTLVKNYPEITFGSYPLINHHYYKTRLTLESRSEVLLEKAYQESLETIPQILKDFDNTPHKGNVHEKIMNFIEKEGQDDLKAVVNESFNVFDMCFSDYGTDNTFVCFNGGKDCIVTLHLLAAYIWRTGGRDSQINSVYIRETDPFSEVENIIAQMKEDYNLNLTTLTGSMKICLQNLLDLHPSCKAMILGTRATDPYSSDLKYFSPTDKDWPKMMRVNPVLHWNYQQIWRFIRGLYLDYPLLYDKGFTSLGSVHNTKPNPHLKMDGTTEDYHPAYMLEDETFERAGRI